MYLLSNLELQLLVHQFVQILPLEYPDGLQYQKVSSDEEVSPRTRGDKHSRYV